MFFIGRRISLSILAIALVFMISSCSTFFRSEPKVYSPIMLTEEKASIVLGKLSKEHEFYQDAMALDPKCSEYIQELSIYDEEINDTFVVHISLPPNYQKGQKYPMVVMTDGIWRLTDHPELRFMMIDGKIKPAILVSIGYPNGYKYWDIRVRDLAKDAESYLHFIVDNLVPYLKENFPVDSANMTLTGHSIGGFWTIFAMFNNDGIGKDTFKNFYIGSPHFRSETKGMHIKDLEKAFYQRKQDLDYNVYISVGAKEGPDFIPPLNEFVSQLKERNYKGLLMKYDIIEGYDHNGVFKPSIRNALLMFYGTGI